MKNTLFTLLMLFVVGSLSAQTISEYDFNSLEMADLDGQDGWNTILYNTGPADFFVNINAGSVVAPDGTNAIFYNASGAGYGRSATRKASDNFDFNLQEAEIIEIEVDMHRNYWGMSFGVGFDADADGYIAPGLPTEPDDGGIQFQIAAQNPDRNVVIFPDGSEVIFTAENSGWCRYKMVLNFAANEGDGAVSLLFDPEMSGEWVAIPEIQGINMGITVGSGNKMDRTVWDGVFFRATGGTAGFDNIVITEMESQGDAQFIDFPAIANMLNTAEPFELNATATSGLEVTYEVLDGPATVDGAMVTLTGDTGVVVIQALQPGNDVWAPATPVSQSFLVVDPTLYTPDLTVRRPADGTKVYMNELSPIFIVASAYIDHPDVLNITGVSCQIEGSTSDLMLTEKSYNTGYYSGEWTPEDYGFYTMTIEASSTAGMTTSKTVTFEVTNDAEDLNVQTFDEEHISTTTSTSVTKDFVFPSYAGSFDQIICNLDVTCPAGGCDPWDRVGSMEVRGLDGQWVELFRYITPYGVPCDHTMDATDYASILQGLVELRFTIGTDDQGFLVDVNFDYQAGEPTYKYSWVDVIWKQTYPFGDYDNLQPVEIIDWGYDDVVESSKLKVINTGHGWGDLNTSNAAEFYEATHKIIVNGDEFDQHLWVVCNPNPDGCQPQNGTWYFNRAGWCPGSIGHVYDYDLSAYVNQANVQIQYEFYPGYMDYCHPNHPDCVTGVTCDNCQSGFNPHYIVSGNLISYSNQLYSPVGNEEIDFFGLSIYPVPTNGPVYLSSCKGNMAIDANVRIVNQSGQLVKEFHWDGSQSRMDLSAAGKGVYFIIVDDGTHTDVKRVIVR